MPCSPHATRRSRPCHGPTAPRCICVAASSGWPNSADSSTGSRRRGITTSRPTSTADVCEAYCPVPPLRHRRGRHRSSANRAPRFDAARRRSSSTWSTTATCSPPTEFAVDLRPWGGATASAVAEMPSGRAGNKTPPVADEVLQPMLAAALHLVHVLGPHAVELDKQIRDIDRASSLHAPGLRHGSPTAIDDIIARARRLHDDRDAAAACSKTTTRPAARRRLVRRRSGAARRDRRAGPAGRIQPFSGAG